MDELQKLYDLLVREGKYTNSFDEFKVKWGSEQGYQDKVFDVVSRDGFYTKDKGTFMSKYGMPQEVKKKEGVVLPPSPSPDATELPLGIGSLEYAKPTKPVAVKDAEKLAVGPMGITGLERTKDYVPASDQGKQGTILNTVSSLDKGFYKNLIGSPVKGLGTALEGVTGKGFVSDALIKFGDYFNKTIDELTPQDEEFKNSLTDQFGQAFGQVASLITTGATGALGKGATAAGAAEAALAAQAAPKAAGAVSALKTLGSELASPTAVSAGLSMGQGEFERAKAAGATDEQAFEAFYKNAAVGSVLEKIPVMQFLKRFEKASAGGISNYIKTKGVAGLTGGIEEMTTEVLQGIYANLTAQDIYDANQKMFEGIGESGGVGFGVGFLLNAMGANVKILRSEGREEEAKVVEEQMKQFESQAAKGGPSSYKISGIAVKSPDIINQMIDNMDATDLVRANIEIENDPELNTKLQDKIITSSIKEQVRQGNPDLNETSLDAITNLELELRKLEGNTTQTGKDKAAAIRTQIKNIQENQLTEEVKSTDRIAELEALLSSADKNLAETGFTSLSQDARVEIEKELQTLKSEQDAIQKQAAGQIPIQPGAGVSETLEGGKPQAGPQVTTEEGVQAEVVQEEVRLFNGKKYRVEGNSVTDLETGNLVPLDLADEIINNGTLIEEVVSAAPEMTEQDQDLERNRLSDKVFEAKRNIARARDTEAAIEEYNASKKELDDFDASVDKRRAQSRVQNIIEDEKTDSQRAGYEYKELFDQDPRLAALQNSKDLLDFVKSENLEKVSAISGETIEELKKSQERSISYIEQSIADLEADLQANPVVSSKTQEVAEPKIKVFRGQGRNMGSGVNEGFNWVSSSSDVASDFGDVSELEIPKPKKTYKFPWARTSQPITGDQLINAVNNAITKAVKEKSITQSQYKSINEKKKLLSTLIDNKIESFQSKVNDPKSSRLLADIFSDLGYDALEVNDDGVTNYGLIKASPTAKPSTTTEVAPAVEVAPVTEAVLEVEQYEPITEADVSHEKFTKDNAIDYEEDTRETDSGREVTYLSRIVVEAMDDNTGDVIGGLIKIVDEDKNVSWQAQDVDGNELGKQDFDSLQEAKAALVKNWNKVQKKEFDKEVKRKAKATEKVAAKAAKKKPVQAPVQEGPTDEEISAIDELLDLDVTDEDNLDRIFNVLDKADKAYNKRLFGQANNFFQAMSDGTASLIIKTLKVLVKGGMLLRDAIKKVAADNNVSQQIVKDILNVADIQDGFDALMVKVNEMIARQTRRGTPEARMISNIDTLVRNSEVYQNATDAQKKILEREARARAGAPARRAPSIGRILGVLKDITNVSREDKLKVISQIRQLSKDAAKDLANEIRDLAKTGKITVNQAANIVARFGKVNMLSEISVSKFVDYMTKVFNDAEYNSKLSSAKSTKRDIAKLSKNKDKDANLRDLGQEFIKIDPSMVENIDEYNEMASKIKEAIKGSTIRGQKVSFASTVNVEDATAYIKNTLAAQDKMMREEKAAEIQSLMGIDVSDFSYEDMMLLLESDKPITKYNEGIIRDTINRAFGIYSSIIKDAMRTGKDPFTGEDVKFTESQKDVVERFMAMDLNVLSPKEALQAVDALANFLQNQSTARMEAVVSQYNGITGTKELNKKGIKAFKLRKYGSPLLARFLGEQTTNLNVLFERMFKGVTAGGMVMDKMGLTKLINKKAAAQTEANRIVDRFVKLFYDKKANGEAFNSSYNNTERGMAAFMMRNVIGTEQEMKAEFDRRKGLIQESIAELEKGNDKEKAKAELYKKAYDKLIAEKRGTNQNQILQEQANNIDDIRNRIDKVNLEGVNFWLDEWNNKYDQLSEVAENVYNKKLDKDINYTPDRFFSISSDTGIVEISNSESAFLVNSGTNDLYQREAGVLMEAVRPDSLPSGRYIDLSFDNNNANSMYDALVDINTAAPIRQIEAFLNSPDFKNVFPNSDDAEIIKGKKGKPGRIDTYIRNIRNKNPYSNDELASVVKKLNKIAAIGVGQALGGFTQPFKQVIPVMLNTLVNAKGKLDLSATFNKAKNDFINNSGYSIANRGIESQAQVESLNKLVEEVSKSKGEKLLNGIEKLNKKWLDILLVKPDVFIARASWLTYYEQSLQKQGVDTKDLDYSTHKLNEDAANYAQRMVDRQQNVSDSDLAGKLFSSRDSSTQLLVKTIMPFASFRMNQASRLGADLATLTNKTSSKEDKNIAAMSLAGFAVEVAAFRLVSIGISILLGSLSKAIMGIDEDDEEFEKRVDNIIKGARTGTFTDIFSPLPIADKPIQELGAFITQQIEDATEMPVAIYSPKAGEYFQSAGLFGIAFERASQLIEVIKLSVTGEYTDDFGKKKTISSDAQDALKMIIAPALMTNIGLAPSEVNSIIRYAIKDSKKSRKSSQEKAEKAERVEDREENKQQKLEAVENVKAETSDPDVLNALQEKIKELKATAQQKTAIEKKNKAERSLKKSLLVDPATGEEYDTETELKRYNKDLWEQNFGEDSKWFREHEAEKEAESLLNKEIRRMEDEEYDYTAPRKKKRARNSDGTFKRKRREL